MNPDLQLRIGKMFDDLLTDTCGYCGGARTANHHCAVKRHLQKLRAASENATPDLIRAIGLELRRRDQGFMQGSVEADFEKGTGTYETFTNGKQVTKTFTFEIVNNDTVVILTPAFAPPSNAVTVAAAPDPYAQGIAAARAAMATPESRFEDEYKASRQREFDAQQRALEHETEYRTLSDKPDDTRESRRAQAIERRLLHSNEFFDIVDEAFRIDAENPYAAEMIEDDPSLTPPDPYAADLSAMKKKDRKS